MDGWKDRQIDEYGWINEWLDGETEITPVTMGTPRCIKFNIVVLYNKYKMACPV